MDMQVKDTIVNLKLLERCVAASTVFGLAGLLLGCHVSPAERVVTGATPAVTLASPGALVFTSNRSELAAQSPGDVFVANADGTGLTNLTRRPAMHEHPVWSPDGSRIAYVSNHSGQRQVYISKANGSAETAVPGLVAPETGV